MAYTKDEPRRSTRDKKKPDVYTSMTAPATKVTKPKKATANGAATTTQKSKPTVKDKVEGAVKKVEGTVTKNPAKKAAGTKQSKGTDGKKGRGRPPKK